MSRPGAPAPDEPSAACREAERVWLEGTDDPVSRARVESHLGRCGRCQTTHARLLALREDVQRAAPPLDDMTRARLLARLTPELDALASSQGAAESASTRVRRTLGSRATLLAGALAAAAVVALLLADPARREELPAPSSLRQSAPHARQTQPPAAPPTRITPPASLALLLQAGAPGRTSRLQVPAGRRLRAQLGDRARLALRGPAALEVVASGGETIELRLTSGALVVDYDRRQGGRLRILSPGAITDVVGTLFSIEVAGERSRVAVARGRVAVTSGDDGPRVLDAGQAFSSGAVAPQPLPPATRSLLERYQREVTPTRTAAPSSTLALAAPAPRTVAPQVVEPATPTPVPPAPAAAEPNAAPIAPPPAPAPPIPLDTAGRYRLAEAAMKRGAWDEARSQLEALVAAGATDRTAAVARYELAQIALRRGDRSGALHWLDDLRETGRDPSLEEPASFLRCEVAVADGDAPTARRCLRAFRVAFPGSASDALALGLLLRLHPAAELCAEARPLLDEFLARYPGHRLAAELGRRKDACRR